MSPFSGKKIWLVGASAGIGEAVAARLAASGARVALSARNETKLVELSQNLPNGPHLSVPVDVTDLSSVRQGWEKITASWGGIDILLYNAGTYDPVTAAAFDLAKVEAMLDVNFRGALRVLDCVLPSFVARRSGHIALVGSVAGYSGLPNAVGYGASKAALLHLAENMRLDLATFGIKVQLISPGFVKTRLTEKNSFPMPFIVTTDKAAQAIHDGLIDECFEIHFPKRFSLILKFLRCLPYALYFRLLKNI